VDFLALKIREKAKEHNVPIVENRPGPAIYHNVELDRPIPANCTRPWPGTGLFYRLKGAA